MRGLNVGPTVAGLITAGAAFGINLAFVAVPVLAAQGLSGGGSATTLDAVLLCLNFLALGHHGAINLSGLGIEGAVTLVPLGLPALFFAVCALMMLKLGRSLALTDSRGALKPGAFNPIICSLAGFTVGYAIAMLVTSLLSVSTTMQPVALSAGINSAAIAALAGMTGLAGSLMRKAHGSVPAVGPLALVPQPYSNALRAIGVSMLAMLTLSTLALVTWMVTRHAQIGALYGSLGADWLGNTILTLGQLLVVPSGVVWLLAMMLGGTISTGQGTATNLDGSLTGVLPALPVLGAIPDPGPFSPWAWALCALPIVSSLLGALLLARETKAMDVKNTVIAWLTYVGGHWLVLIALIGASAGSIGTDQLAFIGPRIGTVMLGAAIVIVVPAAFVAGWSQTGLSEYLRERVEALRAKVDSAEG